MILSHIAAMAKNRVIGKGNKLPWNIPEELKWFRDKTRGHILIMGRKTFESMPRPLPNRFHIVITRNTDYVIDHQDCVVVHSLDEAIKEAHNHTDKWGDEVFITGGSEIYTQSLPRTDRIYLTIIDKEFDGDAFYPEFDRNQFREFDRKEFREPIPYVIYSLERK